MFFFRGNYRRAGSREGPSNTTHTQGGQTTIIEKVKESAGEVRVIVQPIQPVFYMPRQSKEILLESNERIHCHSF